MKLVGDGGQQARHYLYSLDGTIVAGGTPQLVLPQSPSRAMLILQNISNGPLFFEFGSARAKCTISGGVVNAITVTNAGFNFTKPPVVRFYGGGGGPDNNTAFLGGSLPGFPSPSNIALAHCVMTGAVPNLSVASITIDQGGSGYLCAPYVMLFDSDLDQNGCAVPSATSGLILPASSPPLILNGTCCPTDPVAVFGATTGQGFVARWMG